MMEIDTMAHRPSCVIQNRPHNEPLMPDHHITYYSLGF